MSKWAGKSSYAFSPLSWHWPMWLRLHPITWLFSVAVVAGTWVWLPSGGHDWHMFFGPAARHWWPDPWNYGVPYPPWAALLLAPLGGLPDRAATALTNGAGVVVVALVSRRYGGPDWMAIPTLLSPAGYWLFANGQIEWLVLAGLLFYNGMDVFLLGLKPQVAIGAIAARVARARGQRLRYLSPYLVGLALSLIIWPNWPVNTMAVAPPVDAYWNSAVWPWGLPVGLILLYRAWRTGQEWLGVVASPFLFPFVNLPSYLGAMIVLAARWPRGALACWGIMWLFGLALIFALK